VRYVQSREIYAGSKRIVGADDHLGSTRLLSGYSGYPIATYTYGPYGEEFNPQTTVNHYKFTGKERDSESGLDNFGARYMSSSQGRFVTPDPSNLSVDFWLPQTWNRYSYVLNNPLSMKDENGLWPWPIHDRIIDQAFPGLRAQQLQILKDASWNMDYRPGQQSAPLSFQHGMRDGLNNQSASDAERDSDGFIAENEHEAKNIQAQWIASGHTGISPLALAAFGNALHTVTDRTSPAHEGYQPWFGTKWWQKKSLKHFRQEANPWHPNVITAVRAAQDEFVRTFGFGWNQMDLIGLQQRQEVTHRICFTDERGKKICE
jgi:RHS repeat-associated protein